jgi:hypothetical protein
MNIFYKWKKDKLIIINDIVYSSDTQYSDEYYFYINFGYHTFLEVGTVCIKTFDWLV